MPVKEENKTQVKSTESIGTPNGAEKSVEEVLLESDSIERVVSSVRRNRILLFIVSMVVIVAAIAWIAPGYLQHEQPPASPSPGPLALVDIENVEPSGEPVGPPEREPVVVEPDMEKGPAEAIDEVVRAVPGTTTTEEPEEKKMLERPKYASQRKEHLIQWGDTLWNINMSEYGRSGKEIYAVEKRLNPGIVNENLIYAGRRLVLPRNDELPQ